MNVSFILILTRLLRNLAVSDFKQISAQFGRLGQEWINTAGASSGAWLGLFICIAGTCGVVVYKKKKGSIQV